MGTRKSNRVTTRPSSQDPSTWPVVWRVVAPAAGSYDHDMVYLATEDEGQARSFYRELRRGHHPVRLERVSCGPLPQDAKDVLDQMRSASPQNPGSSIGEIPGFWQEAQS
jgi:hypothetical protein